MIRSILLRGMAVGLVLGLMSTAQAQQTHKTHKAASSRPAKSGTAVRAGSGRAAIATRARDPYLGAIVVDADTGNVLFENGADESAYPASVIKLMDLLVIQERIEGGQLSLSNQVSVTAEASKVGGSQVYLAEHEVFSIEDLLYALMIQSANDAATALALDVSGTTSGFVELMNRKAADLGMTNTHFYSCHGLPPAAGSTPDSSTARDLSALARELLKHPDVLRYTSTRERGFRDGRFIMRTHNHLLSEVPGCDGFKTGYFKAGGFSIVATAQRGGRRLICVVLGSPTSKGRDACAKELIGKGFANLPPLPPPPPVVTNLVPSNVVSDAEAASAHDRTWMRWVAGVALGVLGLIVLGIIGALIKRRFSRDIL